MKKYKLNKTITKIIYYFNFLVFFLFIISDTEKVIDLLLFKTTLLMIFIINLKILEKYGDKKAIK